MGRVEGRVSVNPRGFGFLEYEDEDGRASAFIPPRALAKFLQRDWVSAEIDASEERPVAKRLELVERKRTTLFGVVGRKKDTPQLEIDPQISNTPWPLAGATRTMIGKHVVARIEGPGRARVDHVVAEADLSMQRVRALFELPDPYSDADERRFARSKPRDVPGRRDLRDAVTLTIDGPSTLDIDDALGVLPADPDGGLVTMVHIADVGAFVHEGSPLDDEARERATSIYLTGSTIPMLPRCLSEDRISLVQGQERLTLTVEMRIDPEGEVRSVDLYPSVIRSNARLTYEQVERFFVHRDDRGIAKPVQEALRWLRTASARLGAARAARGGMEMDRREVSIELDPDTREPVEVQARSDGIANILIERLMVAANECVARWLHDRGLPALYRVHDEPPSDAVRLLVESAHRFGFELGLASRVTPKMLAALEDQFRPTELAPALRSVLMRLLGPARYTSHPAPHFGLASPLYLHFTSPIRRYPDLVVHRMVKRHLLGERAAPSVDDLESLAEHVNDAAMRAGKAEAQRSRMLAARLFASRIGKRYQANVVAIKPFGLIVYLVGSGLTGVIPTHHLPGNWRYTEFAFVGEKGKRYEIGDTLEAVVDEADEALGRIDLRLARAKT